MTPVCQEGFPEAAGKSVFEEGPMQEAHNVNRCGVETAKPDFHGRSHPIQRLPAFLWTGRGGAPDGLGQVFGGQIIFSPDGNAPIAAGILPPGFRESVYSQGFHNFNKDFNNLCKFKRRNLLGRRVYINAPCNGAAPRNLRPERGVLSF